MACFIEQRLGCLRYAIYTTLMRPSRAPYALQESLSSALNAGLVLISIIGAEGEIVPKP